jgi:uncharacterized protein (DUF486 family)
MPTVVLLVASNVFMTFAWYWHLRHKDIVLWKVILISWLVAGVEYCFAVPANRMGAIQGLTGSQLKIIQEAITLGVFLVFAVTYLKEPLKWNYLAGFALVLVGVIVVFYNRT